MTVDDVADTSVSAAGPPGPQRRRACQEGTER